MTSPGFTFPPPPPPPPKPARPNDTNYGPTNFLYNSNLRGTFRGNFRGRGERGSQDFGRGRGRGDFQRGGRGGAPRGNAHRGGSSQDGHYSSPRGGLGAQSLWPPNPNSIPASYAAPGPVQPPYYPPNHQAPHYSSQGNTFQPRGQKRQHSTAFEPRRPNIPRPPAAPAVPSFGAPLPTLPSAPKEPDQKPNKKQRQHNQLGLTPRVEEHESSEDDDIDEEAKLAASSNSSQLQFSYRGQTATLKSATDIAAWIAERKKKFPTKARIEQRQKEDEGRKKTFQDARKARDDAVRQQRLETQRIVQEEKRAKEVLKEQHKSERQKLKDQDDAIVDEATKAKIKAEKYRRKAAKEEERAAKAEAEAKLAQLRASALSSMKRPKATEEPINAESAKSANSTDPISAPAETQTSDLVPFQKKATEAHTSLLSPPTSITSPPTAEPSSAPPLNRPRSHSLSSISSTSTSNLTISDSSSDPGADPDGTSSSGSSSDPDSDSDAAPETLSSKQNGPVRVQAPPRTTPQQICRQFQRSGRCSRGSGCKFTHAPGKEDRGPRREKKDSSRGRGVGKRKGLYQVLVDKEKEEERRLVMRAIVQLGEQRVLGEVIAGDSTEAGMV